MTSPETVLHKLSCSFCHFSLSTSGYLYITSKGLFFHGLHLFTTEVTQFIPFEWIDSMKSGSYLLLKDALIISTTSNEKHIFINFEYPVAKHALPLLQHVTFMLKLQQESKNMIAFGNLNLTHDNEELAKSEKDQHDALDRIISKLSNAKQDAQETLVNIREAQEKINATQEELDKMHHNLRLSSRLVRTIFSFTGIMQNLVTSHPKRKKLSQFVEKSSSIVSKNLIFDEKHTFNVLILDSKGTYARYHWIFMKNFVDLVDPDTRTIWLSIPYQMFVSAVKKGRISAQVKCKIDDEGILVGVAAGYFEIFSMQLDQILYILSQTVKHFFVNNNEYQVQVVQVPLQELKQVPQQFLLLNKKKNSSENMNENNESSEKKQKEGVQAKLAKLEKISHLTQDLKEMGNLMNSGLSENNQSLDSLIDSVDENQVQLNHVTRKINQKL